MTLLYKKNKNEEGLAGASPISEIWLDLQDNMLLRIFLFLLSMGFSLICRMWAFSIIHNRPLGRADYAFALGWKPGTWVFYLTRFFFGLGEWVCEPIFQTPSIAPQPLCTVHVGKGYNFSRIECDFHVSTRGWVS